MLNIDRLFQDGMALQREKQVKVWGNADAGAKVSVSIQGQTAWADAGKDGKWTACLKPLAASENETLEISDGAQVLHIQNVAVGEVWVAAGQSNMEFWMRYEKHFETEKESCRNAGIRFYDMPKISYDGQDGDFPYEEVGRWRQAAPEELQYFSAAGYFFAKEIYAQIQVPVGIIGCNWGGTPSSVWMSRESVEKYGKPVMDEYRKWVDETDMDKYWNMQKDNFLNRKGEPFEDAFNEFILPVTRPQEEIDAYFKQMNPSDSAWLSMRKPESIPGALYTHMTAHLAPYTVRGVLWYQGESDDDQGHQELYQDMLTALILDWRRLWGEVVPFLVVQLPGWEQWMGAYGSDWMTIRRAQQNVSRQCEEVYLCSISDAGEKMDIHPKDKQVVGQRLAQLACGHIYGKHILCDAPVAKRLVKIQNGIAVEFDFADGGLLAEGNEVHALEILHGPELESIPFQHEIRAGRLILHTGQELAGRVRVALAQKMWYQINLYNQSHIPALPFSLEIEL